MEYKEYSIEDNEKVDLENLKSGFIPREDFISIHKDAVILTTDVMIWYKDGFLLINRDNFPAKGELWSIGGRIERGVPMEEAVKKKAKLECGLELENLNLIGVFRSYWKQDPFGHGKGTDTLSFMYLAEGVGEIKLDALHSNPLIVNFEMLKKIKPSLHPFVRDFMEMAFKEMGKKS